MIESISIRNFQSLKRIDLTLEPLTVIVGPSSSGKSAFIRSLLALIQNRRGTAFISHGERTATITAKITSNDPLRSGTVTLSRSTQTSPNSYVLIPTDEQHPLHPKAEFTKLGGAVPEPISEFLAIPTDDAPLVIASQFDKPYLLDTPAPEVARILASLTNVHTILEAARRSNAQKLEASRTLSVRSKDLEAIKQRIPEFKALRTQRTALDRAEDQIASARALATRIKDLTRLIDMLDTAQSSIPTLTQRLASIPEPQDIEERIARLTAAAQKLARYAQVIQTLSNANVAAADAGARLSTAQQLHDEALDAQRTTMATIAQGFEQHFTEHGDLSYDQQERPQILVSQAASLARDYAAALDS